MKHSLLLVTVSALLVSTLSACGSSTPSDPSGGNNNSIKTQLMWVTPTAGTKFFYTYDSYDTLSQSPDSTGSISHRTSPDSLGYVKSLDVDTVKNAQLFQFPYSNPWYLARTIAGDFLTGDSIGNGHLWELFRGVDTATGTPNATYARTLHNVLYPGTTFYEATQTHVSKCFGVEALTVPAGSFTAIKSSDSEFIALQIPGTPVLDTELTVTTHWFVPSLGCYAKSTYSRHEHDTLIHERMYEQRVLTSYGK